MENQKKIDLKILENGNKIHPATYESSNSHSHPIAVVENYSDSKPPDYECPSPKTGRPPLGDEEVPLPEAELFGVAPGVDTRQFYECFPSLRPLLYLSLARLHLQERIPATNCCDILRLQIQILIWLFCFVIFLLRVTDYKIDEQLLSENSIRVVQECIYWALGFTSISFLITWQRSGKLATLILLLNKKSRIRHHRRTQILFNMVEVGFVLVVLAGGGYQTLEQRMHLPVAMTALFPVHPLHFNVFFSLMLFFWLFSAHLFLCLSLFIWAEIGNFNREFIANLQRFAKDQRRFEWFIVWHSDLCEMIGAFDDVFQFYVFINMFLNVPVLILVCYVHITAAQNVNVLTMAAQILFVVKFSAISISAVLVLPMKISEEIEAVGDLVYAEKSLWQPYEEERFAVTSRFVLLFDTPQMGAQVGDFATITKALIMTIFSLVITYLTLLMQF